MTNPIKNNKPFKKGQSGNPNGRPKGVRNRTTIMRYWLEAEEDAKNPISGMAERMSQADIVTLALIKKARQGDVYAAKELFDSAYGKNPDVLIEESPKRMVLVVKDGDIPEAKDSEDSNE